MPRNKLQVLALAAFCALSILQRASAQTPDADLPKLQGKWVVESFEYNGNPIDVMKDAVREFVGGKYTLKPKDRDALEGTVKIDSSKKPKTIDLDVAGRMLKGIYELDGDTLKMCYNLSGNERPSELASPPDSGIVLVIHKRLK